MTNQEVFNTVWNHFVVDRNTYSVDETGVCQYRGEGPKEGAKCAIGLFIPDDIYNFEMEEWTGPEDLIKNSLDMAFIFKGISTGFLDKLRDCHDSAALVDWDDNDSNENIFLSEMIKNLERVAGVWGLVVPV